MMLVQKETFQDLEPIHLKPTLSLVDYNIRFCNTIVKITGTKQSHRDVDFI